MENLTHAEIVQAANERGFSIRLLGTPEQGQQRLVKARLSGANLAYPVVRSIDGTLSFEISWHLARRLATGETSQVLA